jgi:hypothetical protein
MKIICAVIFSCSAVCELLIAKEVGLYKEGHFS